PGDDEIRKNHVDRAPGKGRSQHSKIWIAALGSDDEPDDGTDEHDAFEPEIYDSGPLADHFAHGCAKDRGAGQHGTREHAGKQRGAHVFSAFLWPRASTTKRMSAIRIFTAAPGRFWVIWSTSRPDVMTASRNDM